MKPIQPVSLNGIEFDAVIDNSQLYSASVPDYPIDAGYSISDNVALNAMQLEMTLYVTATPVTWLSRHGSGESRIQLVCDELLELFQSRELITVVTQDRSYDNMVIGNLEIKHMEESGYSREISVVLTNVTVTAASVQIVPPEYLRAGTTMRSTGNASSTNIGIASGEGAGGGSGEGSSGFIQLVDTTPDPGSIAVNLIGSISGIIGNPKPNPNDVKKTATPYIRGKNPNP